MWFEPRDTAQHGKRKGQTPWDVPVPCFPPPATTDGAVGVLQSVSPSPRDPTSAHGPWKMLSLSFRILSHC